MNNIKNINKETETIKKNQTEILELKNIISKLKNSLEGFNIRPGQSDEINSKHKHWSFEDTCICITESLFCIPETNTTLLITYTPI